MDQFHTEVYGLNFAFDYSLSLPLSCLWLPNPKSQSIDHSFCPVTWPASLHKQVHTQHSDSLFKLQPQPALPTVHTDLACVHVHSPRPLCFEKPIDCCVLPTRPYAARAGCMYIGYGRGYTGSEYSRSKGVGVCSMGV